MSYRFERAVLVFVALVGGGLTIWTFSASPFSDRLNLILPFLFAGHALWAVFKLRSTAAERDENDLFEKIESLERTDPAQADRLLDTYLDEKAGRAGQERSQLWATAMDNRQAARRLEGLLRDELRGHALIRQRVIPTLAPEERSAALEAIDARERETRHDLERLEGLVRQLKSG